MTSDTNTQTDDLLDAALLHVPFDGWSEATFRAAVADVGIDETLARAVCPRGAADLALAFHARGDAAMLARMASSDLAAMKIREKVTSAIRFRLEAIEDREAVRRGVTLFALPQYTAMGARAVWDTCDLIWSTLGDTSEDHNWYTKRATLSGVYSSTLLYLLGDDSPGFQATWDFLDRRIENVMQIEKIKAKVNANPILKPLLAGPNWLLGHVKSPSKRAAMDLPGTLNTRSR